MRSEEGFTLLEMLFVLGIASILMGVFALPASLRDHGSAIRMETVRALAEYANAKLRQKAARSACGFKAISSLPIPCGCACQKACHARRIRYASIRSSALPRQ